MKITLDPGHVQGYNPGCVKGYAEGTRMFEFALVLKKALEARGARVNMTRSTVTENPSLTARGKMAVNGKSDCFLSLHTNAPGTNDAAVRGVLCYRSVQNDNRALGERLTAALAKVMNTKDRKTAVWPSEKRPGREKRRARCSARSPMIKAGGAE